MAALGSCLIHVQCEMDIFTCRQRFSCTGEHDCFMLCLFLMIMFLVCKLNSLFLAWHYSWKKGNKMRAFQISANKHITVPTCVPIPPSFLLSIIEVNAALCVASYLSLRNRKQMSITSPCCINNFAQLNTSHWLLDISQFPINSS